MVKIIFKKQAKVNGKWFAANTQIEIDEKMLESFKNVGALEIKEGKVAVGVDGSSTALPTVQEEKPAEVIPPAKPEDVSKLTKPELAKRLTDLDIEFDSKSDKETLLKLLKSHSEK